MDCMPDAFPTTEDDGSALPERQQRKPVHLPAHLVEAGGVVLDVRLLDLSYNGCRLEVPRFLVAGDAVQLSVPGRGTIAAKVRWCKGGRAGLRFDAEPPPKAEIERSAERRPAAIEAQLRRIGRLNYSVAVRDLSPEGCKIDLVERPAVGEVLHIKLPGLETVETRVRWVEGYVAGLKFKQPIHPAVFDLLMDRLAA